MCWKCGKPVTVESPIGRTAECEFCGSDLHVCRNCRFYDTGSHWDCRETVDEQVYDKERSNFCDFFQLDSRFQLNGGSNKKNTVLSDEELHARHKKEFDSLFGE